MGPMKENPTGYDEFYALWAFLSHSTAQLTPLHYLVVHLLLLLSSLQTSSYHYLYLVIQTPILVCHHSSLHHNYHPSHSSLINSLREFDSNLSIQYSSTPLHARLHLSALSTQKYGLSDQFVFNKGWMILARI